MSASIPEALVVRLYFFPGLRDDPTIEQKEATKQSGIPA
jgi:hypothetical protein